MCESAGWATVRIDGGTDVGRRQDVVNAFNSRGVGQASAGWVDLCTAWGVGWWGVLVLGAAVNCKQ